MVRAGQLRTSGWRSPVSLLFATAFTLPLPPLCYCSWIRLQFLNLMNVTRITKRFTRSTEQRDAPPTVCPCLHTLCPY